MTYYHLLRTCADGDLQRILNAVCVTNQAPRACSVILLYSSDTRKIPMETDSVLRKLADWLEKERKKEHGNNPQHGQIAFVKSGDTRKTQTAQPTLQNRSVGSSTAKLTLQNRSVGSSILGGTTGWNMEVDLGKRLVFPDVVQTTPRPDIVLWSKTGKKLIVIELTVPWETRCEEAYERKKAKYTELLDLCKEKGWRTGCSQSKYALEVFVPSPCAD